MDRREFLRTMLAVPFLAVGKRILGVQKMGVPSSQELTEIVARSIEQGKMSDFDKDQLQLFLNPIDTVRGWIKQGASYPSFDRMEAKTARFDVLPHEGWRVKATSGTDIPNTTDTTFGFGAPDFDTADNFDDFGFWDEASPNRITIPQGQDGYYFLGVRTGWTNMSATLIQATVFRNSKDGSISEYAIMRGQAMASNSQPVIHFTSLYYLNGGDYLTFSAYQNSGGQETIDDARSYGFRWR